MAKTKEKKAPKAKKKAEPEEPKKEAAGQAGTEEAQGQEKKEKEKKKPKEGGGLLLTILTVLLVAVGVGEVALLAFMGFGTIRGIQAQRAYQAQQTAGSGQTTGTAAVSYSYAGPWLTVENGSVTWRREDDDLALGLGGGQTIDPDTGEVVTAARTYPRTPSSPPSAWIKTIDEVKTAVG